MSVFPAVLEESPSEARLCPRRTDVFDAIFQGSAEFPAPSIWLALAEARVLDDLVRGGRGDPSAISGNYGRMTYFSVSTISTSGFGDIVPLTKAARSLAAIESVLGWSLIALFLNAVASRARSERAKLRDQAELTESES